MSLVDLSRRLTESFDEYQRFSSSSDSLIFVNGLEHHEDVPASIDLTVGNHWFDCREDTLVEIPANGLELLPGTSAVLETKERLALPNNIYGMISGKGTLIFRGVIVSPGKIDPGFDDKLKIGIFNAGPRAVWLTQGLAFCCCSFIQMESLVLAPRHRAPAATPRKAKLRRWLRIKTLMSSEWQKPPVNMVTIASLLLSLITLLILIFKKGK